MLLQLIWTTTCKSLVGLMYCHMSWKPEAGKRAGKMRGICSAEELFREMWSEFETNITFLLPTTASATLGRSKAAMDRQFRQWHLLQGQAAEDFHASTEIPLYSFQTIHCLACQHVSRCEVLWRQEIPS